MEEEEKKNRLNIGSRCHVNTNMDGDKFVGVKADTEDAIVYFPMGYELPEEDGQLRKDVQNLFSVLARFMKEDKVFQNDKLETPYTVDFPLHAYLTVIRYYLDHNYYVENEKKLVTGTKGKTDWKRTVKDQSPLISRDGSFIFNERTVNAESPNSKKDITRINKYCVYESFDKLGWLFIPTKPQKEDKPFPDKKSIQILRDALANTFDDTKKKLFKAMIDILKYLDDHSNDKRFYFGTDDFDFIWEKLVDNAFGIKEKDKDKYLPRTRWFMDFGAVKEKKPLIPDTIMIFNEKCYVLDAKFYRYGTTGNPEHLPNGTDINKQITYGEYIRNNTDFKSDAIFNAFVMPYNKNHNLFGINNNIATIGEAVGDWRINSEYYERIQGIVIDTRHLMFHYQDRGDREWTTLADCIEKVIERGEVPKN